MPGTDYRTWEVLLVCMCVNTVGLLSSACPGDGPCTVAKKFIELKSGDERNRTKIIHVQMVAHKEPL